MNYCCQQLPEEVEILFKSEHNPEIIRCEFRVTGSDYGLVLNRAVDFTLAGFFYYDNEIDTYTHDPKLWDAVTLRFDHDIDVETVDPITEIVLPVLDKGIIDPGYIPGTNTKPDINKSERWTGYVPLEEMNKMSNFEWVVATLSSDDNRLISRCVFNVLGG